MFWRRCDNGRIGSELEDVVGAGAAEIGEGFLEILKTVGLLGIGLLNESEQALLHDVEAGESVFGVAWFEPEIG